MRLARIATGLLDFLRPVDAFVLKRAIPPRRNERKRKIRTSLGNMNESELATPSIDARGRRRFLGGDKRWDYQRPRHHDDDRNH